MKKVSVIILNYKQKELTEKCVESVLRQDYKNIEILIVDNASGDGSFEHFKKKFESNRKIRIFKKSVNSGYVGGNNFGYKQARGEYAVILNNDTLVDRKWLLELVKALESDPKIASACSYPVEIYAKNPGIKGRFWVMNFFGHGIFFPRKTDYFEYFYPIGTSFIIKKGIVKRLFPEDYFMYAEDVYLGWLLRLKGYRIIANTKSIVYHYHNVVRKTNRKMDRYFTFLGERNRLANSLIFPDMGNMIKIMPISLMGIIARNLFQIKKAPQRIYSYLWLLLHIPWIARKRKEAQSQRKVSDDEIFRHISCKLFEPSGFESEITRKIVRAISAIMVGYCCIVGLSTKEFQKE